MVFAGTPKEKIKKHIFLPFRGVSPRPWRTTNFEKDNRKEGPRDTPLPLMDDKTSPKAAFFLPQTWIFFSLVLTVSRRAARVFLDKNQIEGRAS